MLDAVRDRWENRGVRCLKCQKKLVTREKLVCKECESQLKAGAIAVLTLGTGLVAAIKSHNKNGKD